MGLFLRFSPPPTPPEGMREMVARSFVEKQARVEQSARRVQDPWEQLIETGVKGLPCVTIPLLLRSRIIQRLHAARTEGRTDTAQKAGLLSLTYTSPSASTERPRWRIVCPTSRELT